MIEKCDVVLVDDHALFRLGVKSVITERFPNFKIIAEYDSGKVFLEEIDNNPLPNLIILDIIMPKISGIKIARIIRKQYPEIKIIMLSSEISEKTIEKLLNIGVDAYLSKLVIQDDLGNAIKTVLAGQQFFGQNIAKTIYEIYKTSKKNVKRRTFFQKKKLPIELSKREVELVELFCDGLTIKEIAQELEISPKTVNNHKLNIMQKLGFHSNIELIKYAIKRGIILL